MESAPENYSFIFKKTKTKTKNKHGRQKKIEEQKEKKIRKSDGNFGPKISVRGFAASRLNVKSRRKVLHLGLCYARLQIPYNNFYSYFGIFVA